MTSNREGREEEKSLLLTFHLTFPQKGGEKRKVPKRAYRQRRKGEEEKEKRGEEEPCCPTTPSFDVSTRKKIAVWQKEEGEKEKERNGRPSRFLRFSLSFGYRWGEVGKQVPTKGEGKRKEKKGDVPFFLPSGPKKKKSKNYQKKRKKRLVRAYLLLCPPCRA